MLEYTDKLRALLADNEPFVAVTIVHTIGSVPQSAGSKMLVTREGLHYGTVGGGKVEKRAIEEAQRLLNSDPGSPIVSACSKDDETHEEAAVEGNTNYSTSGNSESHLAANRTCDDTVSNITSRQTLADQQDHSAAKSACGQRVRVGEDKTLFVDWRLDKDVGMTCGGSVKLFFELFNTEVWNIVVFGAGHCSNSLIDILSKLDCRITCYDSRKEWLDRLTKSSRVQPICIESLPDVVPSIPPGSFVILMTMGHTTDKPILLEILRRWEIQSFPYLGVIGSKAKAARLKKDIQEAGLSAEKEKLFICPMGLPLGNNHPHEIAISIIGQLLEVRDRLS